MSKKIIKRIYNVVIILLFLGAIGWCFSHFYHGSDVAYTCLLYTSVLCQLKAFFIGFHEYLQRNPQYRPDEVKSYREMKFPGHLLDALRSSLKMHLELQNHVLVDDGLGGRCV